MAAAHSDHLRLERRRANLHFSSWRLSSTILRSVGTVSVPAPASPAQASATDYVVAHHAALLNAVSQQPHGCYMFLEDGQGQPATQPQLALCEIDIGEPGRPPQVHKVCDVPQAQQDLPAGGLAAGSLPPSIVEVQTTAAAMGAASSTSHSSRLLLVSSGQGDVSLIVRPISAQQEPARAAAACATSAAVFPLRPQPPLQGVRPVHLLAAFQLPQEQPNTAARVCCILWAPQPRSQQHASRCEIFAVQLTSQLRPSPVLEVGNVQLLRVSDLPPHGVLVNPATGGVLLALQPSSGSVEEEAAAQRAGAAAVEQSNSPAVLGRSDDEDDMSPRTLQAAVARLAAYTSEEPVGPLPHQQYADLYREAGADGVGAMGSEPACALYIFVLADDYHETAVASPAAALKQAPPSAVPQQQPRQHQAPLLRMAYTLTCQPHKLLTCHLEQAGNGAQEPATPDTHLQQAAADGEQRRPAVMLGPRLLLGLTDDVDCAVVAIGCHAGNTDGSSTSSSGGGLVEEAGFLIEHVTSVPAMAYVAAGKVQRKFLLLAPPGSDVACALLETSQYAYLYRSVTSRQEYGEHQIVDMELPDSGRNGLLGAVLSGGRAGACRLLLLARDGLRVLDI